MYADDICIIASSSSALFKLLKMCTEFLKDNTIIFSTTKSKYMCFKSKGLSYLLISQYMYLNGAVLTTVGKTKYLGIFNDL